MSPHAVLGSRRNSWRTPWMWQKAVLALWLCVSLQGCGEEECGKKGTCVEEHCPAGADKNACGPNKMDMPCCARESPPAQADEKKCNDGFTLVIPNKACHSIAATVCCMPAEANNMTAP
eukprot:gnl/TRDRNA2_/TRDRNA2_210062_c0_seq1.p1 gnl/TRDRNA2_/TRDRNA2_210062_c0~~gnl/TRDRNA2_/TRDRNA2_210062_c0_seq1.p1  ORF type:complete len:131 (-),score=14.14 gnl/TRDRNA2_/TRDRNA2_210062_c0_seq1:152-508(-)